MSMPLFEWKVSEIDTDFPANYEIHIFPSPWIARFGDTLNDDLFLYKNVSVLFDRKDCYNENIRVVVMRTRKDAAVEDMWINIYHNVSWLLGWSLIEIFLSVLYIWWFTIRYKNSVWKAIGLTVLAVLIFLNLIPRLASPLLLSRYFPGMVECLPGTITLNATLSEIHSETLLVLLVGSLLEFAALVIILYHIQQSLMIEKDSNAKQV